MKRISRTALLAFGVAALLSGATAIAQTSSTVTVTARASIVEGIAIQRTADLNFGDIATSPLAGTVTVSSAGVVTSGGGAGPLANPGNPAQAASFEVDLVGAGGNKKFWIQLPANGTVSLSNGAASMPVSNFTASLPCAQTGGVAPGPGGCATAPNTLRVGATLSVGANQSLGLYSGTFTVTVHRF